METDYKRIFYESIVWKAYPEKGQNLKKTGLTLRKLEREFPYLLGGGRRKIKKLQVYFTLLPEYAGKKLIGGNPRNWKKECARSLLNNAWERAYISLGCTERISALPCEGCGESVPAKLLAASPLAELPIELWAVRLYQTRPFDSLCILLPEDAGEKEMERLQELLEPYLSRMKKIVYKGAESKASALFGAYLYEEFGIVMMEVQKLPQDMPVIDFCTQEYGEGNLNAVSGDGRKEMPHNLQENGKRPVHISSVEILKFLDIAVKNGYNTKVN